MPYVKYIYVSHLEKIDYHGNWLMSLRSQKRRKAVKNDVKLPNQTQSQRKNLPGRQVYFLVSLLFNFFQVLYVCIYNSWVHLFRNACSMVSHCHVFLTLKSSLVVQLSKRKWMKKSKQQKTKHLLSVSHNLWREDAFLCFYQRALVNDYNLPF